MYKNGVKNIISTDFCYFYKNPYKFDVIVSQLLPKNIYFLFLENIYS